MEPVVEQLELPAVYGTPSKTLAWPDVRARLESASCYWVATTRPDGRPHVVPKDGMWMDDALFYGGAAETVHHRNLTANPAATAHLEEGGGRAVIVEGTSREEPVDLEFAGRLAAASKAKYGWAQKPEDYVKGGVWVLRPSRILAWDTLFEDATRFRFG